MSDYEVRLRATHVSHVGMFEDHVRVGCTFHFTCKGEADEFYRALRDAWRRKAGVDIIPVVEAGEQLSSLEEVLSDLTPEAVADE